jgi:hypothetical protein
VFPEQTTGAADTSAFSDSTAAPVTKAADIVDSSATAGLTSDKPEPDVNLSSGEPGAVSNSSPADAVESHNSMETGAVEDGDMEGVEESTSPQVGGFLKKKQFDGLVPNVLCVEYNYPDTDTVGSGTSCLSGSGTEMKFFAAIPSQKWQYGTRG